MSPMMEFYPQVKWTHVHAVMCSGDGVNNGVHPVEATVDIIHPRQKQGNGLPGWRLVPADSHFVHPQFPGDDNPTIIGGSVFLR